MIGRFIKTLFKIGLTITAIFAVVAAVFYFTEQQTDYIEVYNDDIEGDLF